MKKQLFRTLGFGFLAAAIITACFAILFQGQIPVKGVNVNSVIKNDNQFEASIEEFEKKNELLVKTNESLQDTVKKQDEEIKSLKEHITSLDPDASDFVKSSSSKEKSEDETQTDESKESENELDDDKDTDDKDKKEETGEPVTFVVNDGETAESVALRLEEEGIVSNAQDFMDVMDQWDLTTLLQAGSYDLHKDMDPNAIAEVLTHGVYYYE